MDLALSVGGDSIRPQHNEYHRGWVPSSSTPCSFQNGVEPHIQLDLKLSCSIDLDSSSTSKGGGRGGLDINEVPLALPLMGIVHDIEVVSSYSSSQTTNAAAGQQGDCETDAERGSSKCSDEEERGLGSTRKKLRLSKEQSCYLEESFKEHPTLNPKQKLTLAKQLNLRPRQVEVWFQNRRARSKLKQTEMDCEYLKRCCESLTEENRRLRKELQDLKALKSLPNPFSFNGPSTTLTMCPSCERVSTSTKSDTSISKLGRFGLGVPKSRFYPCSKGTSAAS